MDERLVPVAGARRLYCLVNMAAWPPGRCDLQLTPLVSSCPNAPLPRLRLSAALHPRVSESYLTLTLLLHLFPGGPVPWGGLRDSPTEGESEGAAASTAAATKRTDS